MQKPAKLGFGTLTMDEFVVSYLSSTFSRRRELEVLSYGFVPSAGSVLSYLESLGFFARELLLPKSLPSLAWNPRSLAGFRSSVIWRNVHGFATRI
jgi:hypothetical protein